jgi:erythromycin esterase
MTLVAALLLLGASNLDFEQWGEGRAVGWTRGDGGRLTSECEDVSEGRCAAKLIRGAGAGGEAMTLSQQLPAYAARGHTVTLSGWIRTQEWSAAVSGLWIRVEGEGRELGYASNLISGRAGWTDWQQLEVEVYVDPRAERIVIGTRLEGRGTAWFDDLSLSLR